MITVNQTLPIELAESDKIFIDLVNDNITMYGQIPYTVPPKMIIQVVKQSARFFYKWYMLAQTQGFFRMRPEDVYEYVNNNNSRLSGDVGYFVTLPGYIRSVREVYETGANPITSTSTDAILDSYAASPYSLRGINKELYIVNEVCRITYENALNAVLKTAFPFKFNPLDRKIILGKKIDKNLILECSVNIELQLLYNDELFIRHVIANTKRELKRLLGGHTKPLSGNVTLNPDEICNNIEDAEKVEELVKQTSGVGDIILTND